jgi:hypothetical protein
VSAAWFADVTNDGVAALLATGVVEVVGATVATGVTVVAGATVVAGVAAGAGAGATVVVATVGAVYVKLLDDVAVPEEVASVTATEPDEAEGVTAVTCVAESTVNERAA